MQKKTLKLGVTVAALSCLGLGSVAVVSALNRTNELSVNARATPTSYRVYVINECANWSSSSFYIHYWGGSTGSTWESCPEMVEVLSDYYHGLWYYDVPYNTTSILFKTISGVPIDSQQTPDISLTTYSSQSYVFFVKDDTDSTGKHWWDKQTTAPCNDGQLAAILSKIDVCSSDSAYGYNAWTQLDNFFVAPSSYTGTYSFTSYHGDSTTLGATVSQLSAMYSHDA